MNNRNHRLSLINSPNNGQKGFTLIELIMVIVLLGLLAVVAIPRYRDLRTDAAVASADGVFGAAQGAAAINFANNLVNGTTAFITTGTQLLNAMEAPAPEGWSQAGTTITDGTYTISITTVEAASTKAIVAKSW